MKQMLIVACALLSACAGPRYQSTENYQPRAYVEPTPYQRDVADCQAYADQSGEPNRAAAAQLFQPTIAGSGNAMAASAQVRDRLVRSCLAAKGYR